jgi:hypothetical protein
MIWAILIIMLVKYYNFIYCQQYEKNLFKKFITIKILKINDVYSNINTKPSIFKILYLMFLIIYKTNIHFNF